jgi:F0F1-type ATP synthase delta subunit
MELVVMSEKSEEFFRIMLEFLPSTGNGYEKSIEHYGEVLETVIIENIFMPEIIKLLSENRNIKLLKSIFNYFEEVSNCKDMHLINVFSVTVLESLGNDKTILGVAQEYMGPKTMQLQLEADRALGRS